MLSLALAVNAAQPALQLQPASDGKLRVTATNLGTNSAVLEQTSQLTDTNPWSLSPTALGGTFRPGGAQQFLRLRVIPTTPPAPGSEALVEFADPPATVRSGETITFHISSAVAVQHLDWLVNGVTNGTVATGLITTNGSFTAPLLATNRTVEIRARATVAGGSLAETMIFVTVLASEISPGPRLVTAAGGGIVRSEDGEVTLTIPAGALASDRTIHVVNELSSAADHDTEEFETLALFTGNPDSVTFQQPATIEIPLNRWVEPGTVLPLFVALPGTPLTWQEEGTATVLPGGLRASAALPHFSLWSIRRRLITGPTLPAIPVVTSVLPSRLREGELRPILITGSGLGGVRLVTMRAEDGTPTSDVVVRSFVNSPLAPNELGVLLKSLPNTNQPAGQSRIYRIRLTVGSARFTDVPVTVTGLNEFDLLPQQIFTAPPTPATNRALFSRIRLSLFSTLTNQARVLAWQATDEVTVGGTIVSTGLRGPDGEGLFPGYGSGGAVRLLAPVISGGGTIDVAGWNATDGNGRISCEMIERSTFAMNLSPAGPWIVTTNYIPFVELPAAPRLRVVSIAGIPIPIDAPAGYTVVLPINAPANQTVVIEATGFGVEVPVDLRITPANGPSLPLVSGMINNAAADPAVQSLAVTLPSNVPLTFNAWTH